MRTDPKPGNQPIGDPIMGNDAKHRQAMATANDEFVTRLAAYLRARGNG